MSHAVGSEPQQLLCYPLDLWVLRLLDLSYLSDLQLLSDLSDLSDRAHPLGLSFLSDLSDRLLGLSDLYYLEGQWHQLCLYLLPP